jgi:protein O-mannosyl-transferase
MASAPLTARSLARRGLAFAAIALLCAVAYGGSLRGQFVFDDFIHIPENPLVRDLANYLFRDTGYRAMPNRYVGYLSFALNYRIAGLDVAAFRLVNVLVHLGSALLLHRLVRSAFESPGLARSELRPAAPAIAFVAAALFVAHPLQTEAVTYVVQRFTSLATFFYLASVVLYARWRLRLEQGLVARWRAALGYLPTAAAACLAMATKEISFTLPFAVLLYDAAFFPATRRRLLLAAPLFATACLIPLGILLAPGSANVNSALAPVDRLSPLQYLATQLTVVPEYLRLLVLPLGQSLDHDHPLARSWLDVRVWLSLAFLAAVVLLAAWLHRAGRPGGTLDPAVRLASFGLAWFFLALSVESSIVPLADVMVEHRVYLPSAGFFTAASAAGALAVHRLAPRRFPAWFVALGAGAAVALCAATVARNRVWASELSVWADAAAKAPAKARVRLSLGVAYYEAGRVDDAVREYQAAIALQPGYADAHTNLGIAYLRKGQRQDAAREMLLGVELRSAKAASP